MPVFKFYINISTYRTNPCCP